MDLAAIEAERARLHAEYVKADRPQSSARGIHHTALLSSDVERTIHFYQGVLEFPLTEIIENRDYPGPTTSSSTSVTATYWPSSTSPASTSARTPKSWAACITSRSR